ncbi:MAG: complex I subunit 4 family protein, partial [Solirubrobacteraceae bacterium]
MPPLSIVIWLPALSGLLAAMVPARRRTASGALALAGALVSFGLAVWLIAGYAPGAGLSDVTNVIWIGALGIHYKLGVDGLNVALVGLTTLLYAAAVLASALRIRRDGGERARLYLFLFMLSESAVLGAFLAQDLALFVAFFDLMLIPFYLLIGV